jgi:hypothetical protein
MNHCGCGRKGKKCCEAKTDREISNLELLHTKGIGAIKNRQESKKTKVAKNKEGN